MSFVRFGEVHELDPNGDVVLALDRDAEYQDSRSQIRLNASSGRYSIFIYRNDIKRAPEISFRVSSEHLALASRVFRTMLFEGPPESEQLVPDGRLSHSIKMENISAFEMLLRIIHGRFKTVPRTINLETLTSVAVLVDEYELHEATFYFCLTWVEYLKDSMPQRAGSDLLCWIFISWSLKRPVEFQNATRIAERESIGRVDENYETCFTIPNKIIGMLRYLIKDASVDVMRDQIDRNRQRAISEILSMLQTTLRDYQSPVIRCNRDCDAKVLENLTRALNDLVILHPPRPPYRDISVSNLAEEVQQMSIPTLCSETSLREHNQNPFYQDFQFSRRQWAAEDCEEFSRTMYMTAKSCRSRLGGLILDDSADGGFKTYRNMEHVHDDWDSDETEEEDWSQWSPGTLRRMAGRSPP